MTKKLSVILFAILFSVSLNAQNKMSAYTRLMLKAYYQAEQTNAQSLKSNRLLSVFSNSENNKVIAKAIIELNDEYQLPADELAELEVNIINTIGKFITAELPADNFYKVAELKEIKSISLAKEVSLCNDVARTSTYVEDIHKGNDLPQAYKGEGVIVGVVDSGIDFNHINFKDENGNSRIKLAGCYDPSLEAYNIFYDSTKIAGLTTDTSDGSHGTHVTGIAGGSYTKNGFHGMAPASDLALFGLQDQLYDTDIINGIFWIFNQADNDSKPAVVNVSIGSTMGPHDGTSYFNQLVDEMCSAGKIVVAAAGNNGDEKVHLNKTFSNPGTINPQASTIISCSGAAYTSMVDAWSSSEEPIKIQFFIYDRREGKELYSSNINDTIFTKGEYREFIWQNDPKLASYFSGTIGVGAEINPYNRKHNVFALISGSMTSNNYRIGIKFYGESGTEMNCWAYPTPTEFTNLGLINYTDGTTYNSFSDMVCGKNVISVGAYTTKTELIGIGDDGVEGSNGVKFNYPGTTIGDIAYFSSYGTDLTGRVHPDITAPGFSIVSSVNGYDKVTTVDNKNVLIDEVSIEGDSRKYHWGDMMGTSMASPVVTGIVALWLQANPWLTPTHIRNLLQSTAISDSFTQNNETGQWGAGKVDAKAGLIKILQSTSIKDISMPDNVVMLYPNPTNGKFSIYAQDNDSNLKVSIFNLNGATVFSESITPDNGIVNIDASDLLSNGIYIVKAENEKVNFSSRIIVK